MTVTVYPQEDWKHGLSFDPLYRGELEYLYNAVQSMVQEDGDVTIENNGKN